MICRDGWFRRAVGAGAAVDSGFDPRPQGGDTTPVDDRAVFTAIVFVLTSGCAWRYLPPPFGVTVATAHRRFTDWTKAGLRRRAASRDARRVRQPRPDRLVPRGPRRSVGQGQKGDRLAAPESGTLSEPAEACRSFCASSAANASTDMRDRVAAADVDREIPLGHQSKIRCGVPRGCPRMWSRQPVIDDGLATAVVRSRTSSQ
jgi:transposase